MDCPHRERAGWLCDSFFTGLAATYITGNNLTEKAFLENYAHYESSPFLNEIDKNIIPMCYPASFPRKVFIYNWCQFYVIELYNYISRYNDRNLLNESKRNISRILEFGKQFENEYGLLEDVKGWQFLEWSHANDKESVEGVNFSTNFIYGRMLICAGKLLDDKELINKGLKVLETADRLSFDGLLYHDNAIRVDGKLILTDRISETSQYYALYFGNIDIYKKKEFFDIVINKLGPKRDADKIYPNVFPSAPFIGNYLRLMILAKYGYYEKIKDETVDYLYYMAKETKTLWEMKNDLKSLDHGFTSYIVNLLVEVYTSIRFISPKEKTIYVSKYKPVKNSEINISIPLFDGKKLIFKDGQIILPRGWKIIQGK
jgi:alpha-L-rhamnosidase